MKHDEAIKTIREALTWMDHFAKRHCDGTIENIANEALIALDQLAAEPREDALKFARSLGKNGVYDPFKASALITAHDERIRRECADNGVESKEGGRR
jgi:hypothetical protein